MKLLCLSILLFSFLSVFAQSDKAFVGKYESAGSGLPMGYDWFLGNSYVQGVGLTLNGDGTFLFEACTVLKGNWETKSDSLYLFVESRKFRNDSLNRVGFNGKFLEVPEEPLKLAIIEKGFLSHHLFDYEGETYNAINKLVRVPSVKDP